MNRILTLSLYDLAFYCGISLVIGALLMALIMTRMAAGNSHKVAAGVVKADNGFIDSLQNKAKQKDESFEKSKVDLVEEIRRLKASKPAPKHIDTVLTPAAADSIGQELSECEKNEQLLEKQTALTQNRDSALVNVRDMLVTERYRSAMWENAAKVNADIALQNEKEVKRIKTNRWLERILTAIGIILTVIVVTK